MSDTPPQWWRTSPRRIKPDKVREPPKIKRGTWVVICPDDPDLRTFGRVEMCLPGAKVEIRLRNGSLLTVPRSMITEP